MFSVNFCVDTLSFLLDVYLGVEWLGHMVILCFTFWEAARLFPTAAAPAMYEVPISPHSRQHLLLSVFFDSSHPTGREVLSLWFDLHFPDGQWCRASPVISEPSSLEKYLFLSFAHFSSGYWSFYPVVRVPYTWLPVPYRIYDVQVIRHSVGCLFTFFMLSFETQKFSVLLKLTLSISLIMCAFGRAKVRKTYAYGVILKVL